MSHRAGHSGAWAGLSAESYDAMFPEARPDVAGDLGPGGGTTSGDTAFSQGYTLIPDPRTGQLVAVSATDPTAISYTGISIEGQTPTEAQQLAEAMTNQARALRGAFPEISLQDALQQSLVNLGIAPASASPFRTSGGISASAQADLDFTRARIEQITASIQQADDEIALAREQGNEQLAQQWVQIRGQLENDRRGLDLKAQELGATTASRQRELDLVERGQNIDVQQFAAQLGLNYDQLAADLGSRNADRLLQFAVAQGDVETQNALRRFNAAESSRERALALTQLQAADRRAGQAQQAQLLDLERQTIGDLAKAASDPVDRGLYAGLLEGMRASGQFDPLGAAISQGGSAVGDQNLQNIGGLLSLQDRIRAAQQSAVSEPGIFNDLRDRILSESPSQDVSLQVPGGTGALQVAAPAAPTGPAATGAAPATPAATDAATASAAGPQHVQLGQDPSSGQSLVNEMAAAGYVYNETTGRFEPAPGHVPGSTTAQTSQESGTGAFHQLAAGGTLDQGDVAVAGEGGEPELLIHVGGKTHVIPFHKLMGMQGGGVFPDTIDQPAQITPTAGVTPGTTVTPSTPADDAEARARAFLADVVRRAKAGTPFEQQAGRVRPIQVAAPGTDPILQQLAASIAQTEGSAPIDAFLRGIQRLMLQGIDTAAPVGRVA